MCSDGNPGVGPMATDPMAVELYKFKKAINRTISIFKKFKVNETNFFNVFLEIF